MEVHVEKIHGPTTQFAYQKFGKRLKTQQNLDRHQEMHYTEEEMQEVHMKWIGNKLNKLQNSTSVLITFNTFHNFQKKYLTATYLKFEYYNMFKKYIIMVYGLLNLI